ncbi:uncharacterized protein PAC_19903 [Phialocephala subalpina]|uniref:CFEM domain-containing protein n=1 Tax=Phialocephala subalpina TaxID=576137 RepID=A0A1L7XY51_9HELO|nr:uncharacterized protein PAC_19903 [Phialocephala subalpina]
MAQIVPSKMILLRFWFITTLVAPVIFYADRAAGQELPPACSVNCPLTTLDRAGCQLTDIRNCLCTDDNLQYELSPCVFVACDQAEQIVVSEIIRNQLCKGVAHKSRSTEIVRAEIILAAFTFPMIALRLISRVWVAQRVWWDDWMVLLAAMFIVPMTTIPIYTANQGLGKHIWNVPAQNTKQLLLAGLGDAVISTDVYTTAVLIFGRVAYGRMHTAGGY